MDATRRPHHVLWIALTLLAVGCGEAAIQPPDGGTALDATIDAAPMLDAGRDAGSDGGTDAAAGDAGPACEEDETLCGEDCVRLDDDPQHCGACDVDCDALPGVRASA
jgi:hypothetical protein